MNHMPRYLLLLICTSAHAFRPNLPPYETIRIGRVAVPSVSGPLVPLMLIYAILADQEKHNGSSKKSYPPQKHDVKNKKFPKQKYAQGH